MVKQAPTLLQQLEELEIIRGCELQAGIDALTSRLRNEDGEISPDEYSVLSAIRLALSASTGKLEEKIRDAKKSLEAQHG